MRAIPLLVFTAACGAPTQGAPGAAGPPATAGAASSRTQVLAADPARPGTAPAAAVPPPHASPPTSPITPVVPVCAPADWSPRALAPLLEPGKTPDPSRPDRVGSDVRGFDQCGDGPNGPGAGAGGAEIDGVSVRVAGVTPAGTTGRKWPGNQCSLELRLANGAGRRVVLGPEVVPPFNVLTSLVRSGSAAWVVVSFNGYTREFPKGGNRVIAVDLCAGKVAWTSPNSTSNTDLLLLGDYLVTAFGFTSEKRFVHVLDARSGHVIQKLRVVENVCPSKSWAPNWDGGPCDRPGQDVGAATRPRVDGGIFFVDTNIGSSSFQFKAKP
jgi:hypothetical protein